MHRANAWIARSEIAELFVQAVGGVGVEQVHRTSHLGARNLRAGGVPLAVRGFLFRKDDLLFLF